MCKRSLADYDATQPVFSLVPGNAAMLNAAKSQWQSVILTFLTSDAVEVPGPASQRHYCTRAFVSGFCSGWISLVSPLLLAHVPKLV